MAGTGDYYYADPSIVGMVSTEDMVVMMDEMGIDTGVDVDRLLGVGRTLEKNYRPVASFRMCPYRGDT